MPAAHRFGLIGCGRIGAAVVEAWQQGLAPGWQLQGVLARSPRRIDGVATFTDATAFLALDVDLIVEVAGPQALAQLGPQALLRADTWTVSATALADPAVFEALWAAGAAGGHRLRVLAGAIAGLDGVAAASVDPDARLQLSIDLPPVARPSGVAPEGRQVVFTGSVRQAAARFPTKVNVAAAAALAGPGLDRARIEVAHPDPAEPWRLALRVDSRYGRCEAVAAPRVAPGVHPVAASVIAALRSAVATIWVG